MNAIFAVNSIDGFGTGSDMPWPRSSIDFKRFKQLTTGHTVVMGRNTWNSDMPKPLPGRRNCVLSSTLVDSRCEVFSGYADLLESVKDSETVFVIGGTQILWLLRDYINAVYLTTFTDTTNCAVKLDLARYLTGFKLTYYEQFIDHRFEIYHRV